MKKINITVSMPEDTQKLLYSTIGPKKISAFVSKAVAQALNKEIEELKLAYKEAENDPDRKEVLNDWAIL